MQKHPRPDRENTLLVGSHVKSDIAREFQIYSRIEGKTSSLKIKEYVEQEVSKWRKDKRFAHVRETMKAATRASSRSDLPTPP